MIAYASLRQLCRELLVAIGEDPDREGLRETPDRWARWWQEFIGYDPGTVETGFQSVTVDQLVVVRGIRVWSLCEHHLLPFSCDITMGYLTGAKVLGLSKFARVAQKHAHRLQVQERLVADIAKELRFLCASPNVAVVGAGEHLCMTMRGVRAPGRMVCSALEGAFKEEAALRAEFMRLVGES